MSRIDGLRWDSWPEPIDVALLRALLHRDAAVARRAWDEFRSQWDPDSPTGEQYRLFGLIADRLEEIAPDDTRIGMFRGMRRRTAVNTMLHLDRLERHLQTLDDLSIEPVLLKGAALALTVYGTLGQRWFADLDLLVPPADWDRVAAVYRQRGWQPTHEDFPGNHGVNFVLGDDTFDLHRLPQREMVVPGNLERAASLLQNEWSTRPLSSGRHVRVLVPTDALLHTLLHGTQRELPHNLRWAVDADRLIATGRIDWWRLVSLARTFRVSPVVHDALVFLGTLTGEPVERWVLDRLAADRLSWLERRRLDAIHEWPTEGRLLGRGANSISWALLRTRGDTRLRLLRSFPRALADNIGLGSVWRLPVLVVRRLGRVRSRP